MPHTSTLNGSNKLKLSQDDMWRAVTQKETGLDGVFFYCVRTTGIYCRPSCPSRLALRENVEFVKNCELAEKEGYRACKRCKPNNFSLEKQQSILVERACRLIEEAETPPGLEALAEAVGVSKFHFHRIFKTATGVTPKAYSKALRAKRVRAGLHKEQSVTSALYGAGYNASSRFYEEAASRLGMKPTSFRDGGKDIQIRFAVGECHLGSILVASSDIGVCSIELGDDPDSLVYELQDRFPNAKLIGGEKQYEITIGAVIAFVDAPGSKLDISLDIRGTAFQQKVWDVLRLIPAGSVLSYSEVATAIGNPKAVRAVAGACAANKLALAIPCHRVVRNDGSLSGYRWGVERKRKLLAEEATLV